MNIQDIKKCRDGLMKIDIPYGTFDGASQLEAKYFAISILDKLIVGEIKGGTMTTDKCVWSQEELGFDYYSTTCGKYFTLNEGTPFENEFKYCTFCGKEIDQDIREEGEEDDHR